jgi:glycosyltransferase involved in cell wall biosynthesis
MLIPGKSLFHVLYSDTDLWLLGWSSRITRNPIIATFHDPPSNLKWLQIDERIVDNLAAVVLVSESQRPHFKTLLPPDHIFFVPHGIDTEFFIPGEKLSSEQICITVGSHERDFATLTKAIDIVHKEKPHVRFIAVGAHRESPFEHERVEFLDHVGDKELLKLYQTAMVAVFSFYGATANNALLEAMACGLPVVSTDVGGVREYLGDDAGILCPPHDPDALAAAMLELLNNPLAAEKMGKASRARALKYDYQIVSNKMGQIYYKILKEG